MSLHDEQFQALQERLAACIEFGEEVYEAFAYEVLDMPPRGWDEDWYRANEDHLPGFWTGNDRSIEAKYLGHPEQRTKNYQDWYTEARGLVEILLPLRRAEFVELYTGSDGASAAAMGIKGFREKQWLFAPDETKVSIALLIHARLRQQIDLLRVCKSPDLINAFLQRLEDQVFQAGMKEDVGRAEAYLSNGDPWACALFTGLLVQKEIERRLDLLLAVEEREKLKRATIGTLITRLRKEDQICEKHRELFDDLHNLNNLVRNPAAHKTEDINEKLALRYLESLKKIRLLFHEGALRNGESGDASSCSSAS